VSQQPTGYSSHDRKPLAPMANSVPENAGHTRMSVVFALRLLTGRKWLAPIGSRDTTGQDALERLFRLSRGRARWRGPRKPVRVACAANHTLGVDDVARAVGLFGDDYVAAKHLHRARLARAMSLQSSLRTKWKAKCLLCCMKTSSPRPFARRDCPSTARKPSRAAAGWARMTWGCCICCW